VISAQVVVKEERGDESAERSSVHLWLFAPVATTHQQHRSRTGFVGVPTEHGPHIGAYLVITQADTRLTASFTGQPVRSIWILMKLEMIRW